MEDLPASKRIDAVQSQYMQGTSMTEADDIRPEPRNNEVRWFGSDHSVIVDRCTHVLTESEVDELERITVYRRSTNKRVEELRLKEVPLPSLASTLRKVRHELECGPGVQIIRGVPVNSHQPNAIASFLWLIGLHLGSPIPQNAKGELISSVRDIKVSDANQARYARGYQTSRALPFHSDSCDVVGLLCLAEALKGGVSMIASSAAIHDYLLEKEPDLLSALYEPYYIDRRGEGAESSSCYYATPIFMKHRDRIFSRFNPGYVYAAQRSPDVPRLTELQLKAMNRFHELCNCTHFKLQMEFKVGDLQLLNNNIVVHGRSAYQDGDDERLRRHLLRIWLMINDLESLPPQMRDRYCDMERWCEKSHVPVFK
jgi:hypothetical protein